MGGLVRGGALLLVWGAVAFAAYLCFGVLAILAIPGLHLPFLSDAMTSTASDEALAGFVVWWLSMSILIAWFIGPFARRPVSAVRITDRGMEFFSASRPVGRVEWRDPGIRLVLDRYSALLDQPNPEGFHWGVVKVVRGHSGGVCQFDEPTMAQVIRSAEGSGVRIAHSSRRSLEGPVERLRFTYQSA